MEPSHTRSITIGHLDTRAGVRQELTRIYRAMRRGELDPAAGTKLAFVLLSLAKLLEQDTFEAIRAAALAGSAQDNGRGSHDDL